MKKFLFFVLLIFGVWVVLWFRDTTKERDYGLEPMTGEMLAECIRTGMEKAYAKNGVKVDPARAEQEFQWYWDYFVRGAEEHNQHPLNRHADEISYHIERSIQKDLFAQAPLSFSAVSNL